MIVPEPACVKVPVPPLGEEVAVYEMIVAPPVEPGAVNVTVAVVDPVAVADTPVGAPGATAGAVIESEALDAPDVPALFVAVTVNV